MFGETRVRTSPALSYVFINSTEIYSPITRQTQTLQKKRGNINHRLILNSLLTSANKSKYRKSKNVKSKSYRILVLSRISHEYPLVIHGYPLDIHWMSGPRYPVDVVWLSALDIQTISGSRHPMDILLITVRTWV